MDVSGFLNKAAEKTGFVRDVFKEENIPTDPSRITVVPFFGDIRSLFVLSSILLNRVRSEERSSKYLIVCSWPGFGCLFPYADEYWSIQDESVLAQLYASAKRFSNNSDIASSYYRSLNQHFFEDVIIPSEYFKGIYDYGIMDGFWKKYKKISRTLPNVSSSASLGKIFNRDLNAKGGYKVFICPSLFANNFSLKNVEQVRFTKDFWITLIKVLIQNRFVPVIHKGFLSYDLSSDFGDQCIYFNSNDFSEVLSAMRATGLVLDVFNGTSRLAVAARCPFIAVDDRSRYSSLKEYEIDDLCAKNLPKQYLFSFSTIITDGNPTNWGPNLISGIIAKLNAFVPDLDRDTWPSTGESTEFVSYDSIRKKKLKKIGTRLLKVPKD